MRSILRLLRVVTAFVLLSSQVRAGDPSLATQLSRDLGNLHLGQAGVVDLQLGYRTRSWEVGVLVENLANLEGWDVQRDERSLFAAPAGRTALPAEEVPATPNNPWNVRLFVTVWF
jgi:hypothetical protein